MNQIYVPWSRMFMEVKIRGERLGSDLQALPMFKKTLTCSTKYMYNHFWCQYCLVNFPYNPDILQITLFHTKSFSKISNKSLKPSKHRFKYTCWRKSPSFVTGKPCHPLLLTLTPKVRRWLYKSHVNN